MIQEQAQIVWKEMHSFEPSMTGDYLVANRFAARVVGYWTEQDAEHAPQIKAGWQDLHRNHIFTHWATIPFPQ